LIILGIQNVNFLEDRNKKNIEQRMANHEHISCTYEAIAPHKQMFIQYLKAIKFKRIYIPEFFAICT